MSCIKKQYNKRKKPQLKWTNSSIIFFFVILTLTGLLASLEALFQLIRITRRSLHYPINLVLINQLTILFKLRRKSLKGLSIRLHPYKTWINNSWVQTKRAKTKSLDFQTSNHHDIKLNHNRTIRIFFIGFTNCYRNTFCGISSLRDDSRWFDQIIITIWVWVKSLILQRIRSLLINQTLHTTTLQGIFFKSNTNLKLLLFVSETTTTREITKGVLESTIYTFLCLFWENLEKILLIFHN